MEEISKLSVLDRIKFCIINRLDEKFYPTEDELKKLNKSELNKLLQFSIKNDSSIP